MSEGSAPGQDDSETEARSSPPTRAGNRPGAAGFVLVLAAWAALFAAMAMAGALYSSELDGIHRGSDTLWALVRRSEADPDTLGHRNVIGAMMLGGILLVAGGLACGVWGLRRKRRPRGAAVAAVVLGSMTLLCVLASFVVTWFRR